MSRQLMILLFLLCSGGLIFYAHGAESQEKSDTEMSSSDAGDSGGGGIVDTIMSGVNDLLNMIMDMIQPILDTVNSFVMSILNTVFMSDDTRMTTSRRRRSVEESAGSSSGGSSIMRMVSDIFLAPFKLTFGILRDTPVDSILNGAEDIMSPLRTILDTAPIQALTNRTHDLFDAAANEFWNFTKISILPGLNDAVTTLRETNTLPARVDNYLADLQSLYTLCHTFGIV